MAEGSGRNEGELEGVVRGSKDLILEMLLETSPMGIIIQDAEGRDIIANSRAEHILGIDRDEITSRRYDSQEWDPSDRHGTTRRKEETVAERVRTTGRPLYDVEMGVKRGDGSRVILSVNAAPILGEKGDYKGLIYMFEDVTERVRVEEELKAQRENLEDLVEKRAADLLDLNRQLESEIEERKAKEKELRELSNRMRSLAQRIEAIRESERSRIAARMHDSFEQSLAVLKMQLKDLEKALSREGLQLAEMDDVYDTIGSFLEEVQDISADLRPRILDDAGLIAAIEWQMNQLHQRTGIETFISSDLGGMPLTQVMCTFIFRIFQEALENAVRHSQATRVDAGLQIVDKVLELILEDNGKGISRHELANQESLGLLWMRERARQFGGEIDIVGHPDKGTKVILRIPMGNA